MFDDFIVRASKQVKNEHQSPISTVKNDNVPAEVLIIDLDDEPAIKAEPGSRVEPESIDDASARNESSDKSIVFHNTKNAANQIECDRTPSNETFWVNSCQPSTSGMHVKHAVIQSNKYRCEVCSRRYKGTRDLIYHRRIHLDLNSFRIHCRNCLRTLKTKAERAIHEMKCDAKRFECYLCGKTICHRLKLLEHMRVHTGQRPFKCDCNKCFKSKHSLNRHQRSSKHKNTNVI